MKEKLKVKVKTFWSTKKSTFKVFIIGVVVGGLLVGGLVRPLISAVFPNKEVINRVALESQLKAIDEWACYEYDYTGFINKENSKDLFGIDIPLTTNRVDIYYTGTIKVGFSVEETLKSIGINNKTETITIKFSEPKVLDNYVKLDDLKISENNNLLNPIRVGNLKDYFKGIEETELSKAEKRGIYDKAKKHAKKIIKNVLKSTSEYKIIYT